MEERRADPVKCVAGTETDEFGRGEIPALPRLNIARPNDADRDCPFRRNPGLVDRMGHVNFNEIQPPAGTQFHCGFHPAGPVDDAVPIARESQQSIVHRKSPSGYFTTQGGLISKKQGTHETGHLIGLGDWRGSAKWKGIPHAMQAQGGLLKDPSTRTVQQYNISDIFGTLDPSQCKVDENSNLIKWGFKMDYSFEQLQKGVQLSIPIEPYRVFDSNEGLPHT